MPPTQQNEPVAAPVHKSWVFAHPYVTILCCAAILVLIGAVVVTRRTSTNSASPGTQAWGGGIQSLLNPEGYASPTNTDSITDIMQGVQTGAPYTYSPPDLSPKGTGAPVSDNGDSWDYDSIIALLSLSGKGTSGGGVGANTDLETAYSFIPQGLVSTTTDQSVRRNRAEQELFDYGNEVGSYIKSFEDMHGNMVQIMKDHIEDQGDSGKSAAFVRLAKDLESIGKSMKQMEFMPKSVQGMHNALADNYIALGANLQLIPNAHSTKELLDAIGVYNASADTFVKNYVAIATLFSVSNVKFAEDDPGSIFMFTNASGF